MKVKRAKSGIHDMYRGVFLNRGVFVKAPPEFFASYPSDFEEPPAGYEKLNVTLREIPTWDRKFGMVARPKPEITSPAPAKSLEPAPVVTVAVPEPVAASDNVQQSIPTPDVPPIPTVEAPKKAKARSRTVKIKK